MTITFKTASLNPLPVGNDVLYTMPALKNGLLVSVIAATTNIAPRNGSLGVLRAGESEVSWLANNISVASGSSVNLLAGKVALNAGDAIAGNQGQFASAGQYTLSGEGQRPYAGEPSLLLSNANGSIIVAACPTGIFYSTDGGVTATRATTETLTTKVGMFFGGLFHVYTSATSKRTSPDGITWTTVACTNAPVSPVNVLGDIIIKGGAAYGLASTTQMVTSTDGTTWTNYGVVLPAACNSLCWTGINFVAGSSAANGNIYWSTNAAAWTTVAGLASTAVNLRGIAAVEGNVVVGFGTQLWASTDHGVTLVTTTQSTTAGYPVVSTGAAFLAAQSALLESISETGATGTWTSTASPFGSDISNYKTFAIAGTRLISARSHSFDLELTRRGGMTITASILEIAP